MTRTAIRVAGLAALLLASGGPARAFPEFSDYVAPPAGFDEVEVAGGRLFWVREDDVPGGRIRTVLSGFFRSGGCVESFSRCADPSRRLELSDFGVHVRDECGEPRSGGLVSERVESVVEDETYCLYLNLSFEAPGGEPGGERPPEAPVPSELYGAGKRAFSRFHRACKLGGPAPEPKAKKRKKRVMPRSLPKEDPPPLLPLPK